MAEPEIDLSKTYDAIVVGSGAGGGGFFLLCVPSDKRQAVRHALANLREMPFRLERGGSRIVVNMQRY